MALQNKDGSYNLPLMCKCGYTGFNIHKLKNKFVVVCNNCNRKSEMNKLKKSD